MILLPGKRKKAKIAKEQNRAGMGIKLLIWAKWRKSETAKQL